MPDKTISQLEGEGYTHIECEYRNPACRDNVWYPFKLIRQERPRLMISAMTIAELGAKMLAENAAGRMCCARWHGRKIRRDLRRGIECPLGPTPSRIPIQPPRGEYEVIE
jgi:hypothetical protein